MVLLSWLVFHSQQTRGAQVPGQSLYRVCCSNYSACAAAARCRNSSQLPRSHLVLGFLLIAIAVPSPAVAMLDRANMANRTRQMVAGERAMSAVCLRAGRARELGC